MQIRVDLLPSPPYDDVVVLIDVLRTGTVAPILFENGLEGLRVSTSSRLARRVNETSAVTLIGERKGVPSEGFNYGNSPAQLRRVDMAGKQVVLVSENISVIVPELGGTNKLLLASLYNATAAAEQALKLANERIYLVCCGLWGQEDLDDILGAGFLAAQLQRLEPAATFSGGSRLAANLLKSFPDPLAGLWHSGAGQYLRALNLEDDLATASLVDQSALVPRLSESHAHDSGQLYTFSV